MVFCSILHRDIGADKLHLGRDKLRDSINDNDNDNELLHNLGE